MARIEFNMPDDFNEKLKKLEGEDLRRISETALKRAARVVLEASRSELKRVLDSNRDSRSTGELLASLGVSPVDISLKNGYLNVSVGFNEPRRKQTAAKKKRSYNVATNAMIATVLEYGRHGQPARPFMSRARNRSKKAALDELERVYMEEMDKL